MQAKYELGAAQVTAKTDMQLIAPMGNDSDAENDVAEGYAGDPSIEDIILGGMEDAAAIEEGDEYILNEEEEIAISPCALRGSFTESTKDTTGRPR